MRCKYFSPSRAILAALHSGTSTISQSLTKSKVSASLIYFRRNGRLRVTSQHVPKFELTIFIFCRSVEFVFRINANDAFNKVENGEK